MLCGRRLRSAGVLSKGLSEPLSMARMHTNLWTRFAECAQTRGPIDRSCSLSFGRLAMPRRRAALRRQLPVVLVFDLDDLRRVERNVVATYDLRDAFSGNQDVVHVLATDKANADAMHAHTELGQLANLLGDSRRQSIGHVTTLGRSNSCDDPAKADGEPQNGDGSEEPLNDAALISDPLLKPLFFRHPTESHLPDA